MDEHSPQRLWIPELTARQRELLPLITAGWSNQEIAEHEHLVMRTALSHVDHILTRLVIPNRTVAALWAIATGQVTVDQAVNLMLQQQPHLGANWHDHDG